MSNVSVKVTIKDINELTEDRISEDGRHVSEQEYWEHYYEHLDFTYEWNNGVLEEVPVSDFKNIKLYRWLMMILEHFLQTHKIGEIVFHEFGFRLALPEKVSIRIPDLAVVLKENYVILDNDDRSYKGVYDLCVELISDLTRKAITRDTEVKKMEYEAIGVKEYYILDAENRYMAFYRRNEEGFFEPIKLIADDIVRSEVLKGFQFRISDLFRQPSIEELTDDELYNSFILPKHKMIKERLEKERQRAEKLEAKLRAHGISID
jgi:Uma2 family endonuclease